MVEREEYLMSLIPDDLDYVKKYWSDFEKNLRYMGNGAYSWKGVLSDNVRELFLVGVLLSEKIDFEKR